MIAMGCAICREQKYIAHKGKEPLPMCDRHLNRSLVDWSYIKRYPEDKLLGEVISNKYVLIRPLGKGGFGSVYFAVQKRQTDSNHGIRKVVAIKFLTRISEDYIELFNDEMRLMSHLRNQYIVQLFGSGQHKSPSAGQNLPYMVMEFVEGETLSDRLIRQGALSPRQVILLVKQLLSALIEAHDKGIIHRDLKPLNLMICPDSKDDFRLVVLDFGISKMMDDATREATRNKIMGTPYYLAPEILLKGELSYHTDLFAVAVIAYESLSYHSPFLNEELSGIEPYLRLRSIYKDQKKPDPLPAHLPKEWTLFFECSLNCDVQQRFPDAKSMLIAIEALEQRTVGIHQEIEKDVQDTYGNFEDDEETMLFKKQLMSMSDEHKLEKNKTTASESESANQDLDELSILESVDMIDPVEVLTTKSNSLPLATVDQSKLAGHIPKSLPKHHSNLAHQVPALTVPPPLPTKKLEVQAKPPPLPKEVIHALSHPAPRVVKETKPIPLMNKPVVEIKPEAKKESKTPAGKPVQPQQLAQSAHSSLNTNDNLLAISSPQVLTIQVGSASPLLGQIPKSSQKSKTKNQIEGRQSLRQVGQRQSGLHKNTYTSVRENTLKQGRHKRSNSFIWLQLLIMVGLGIGFAYVVAHYILN